MKHSADASDSLVLCCLVYAMARTEVLPITLPMPLHQEILQARGFDRFKVMNSLFQRIRDLCLAKALTFTRKPIGVLISVLPASSLTLLLTSFASRTSSCAAILT